MKLRLSKLALAISAVMLMQSAAHAQRVTDKNQSDLGHSLDTADQPYIHIHGNSGNTAFTRIIHAVDLEVIWKDNMTTGLTPGTLSPFVGLNSNDDVNNRNRSCRQSQKSATTRTRYSFAL